MGAVLIAGTNSDAGKSVVTAGICRWLARQGVAVAPFKAQNMSLNSFVTLAGEEIGRAQAAQARACGIEPEAVMNPILLKPGSDNGSQLIVLGRAVAETDAASYWTSGNQPALLDIVVDSYHDLTRRFDAVICEGAGSPAEINLRESDIVNMGFEPGLGMLEELTGRQVLGVLPYTDSIAVDAEDSIDWALLQSAGPPCGDDVLRISVVAFPRMSNHTDLDALACEPGVIVRFARQAAELADADLVILPGSRATVADLAWLRERQIDDAIVRHAARGMPVLGICGGYQMLGTLIDDNVESGAGQVRGLAMLPVRTEFGREKVLARPSRTLADGVVVHGYEILHGVVSRDSGEPFFADEGCRGEAVAGTAWHGLMENDSFRREYLSYVARVAGRSFTGADDICFDAIREAKLDRLADVIADNLDGGRIEELLESGAPSLPALRLTLQPGVAS